MPVERFSSLGLELTYRTWGPPEGTPLVLLHGLLDTGAAHAPLAEELATAGFRVVALDQRGHGDSAHAGAGGYYHFSEYVLDLDGLLRHAGLDEGVILAGHSMGAAVGAYFTGTFPERVLALVMMDAAGPATSVAPEQIPGRWRRWIEGVRHVEARRDPGAPDLDAIADRIGRMSPRSPRSELLRLAGAAARQREDGRWVWRFDPLHRTQAPYGFDAERFRAFLARIDCPVLMVWAEHSPLRSDEAVARLQALRDLTERVIPDAGHNLHHERPHAVAEAILTFLEDRGL